MEIFSGFSAEKEIFLTGASRRRKTGDGLPDPRTGFRMREADEILYREQTPQDANENEHLRKYFQRVGD